MNHKHYLSLTLALCIAQSPVLTVGTLKITLKDKVILYELTHQQDRVILHHLTREDITYSIEVPKTSLSLAYLKDGYKLDKANFNEILHRNITNYVDLLRLKAEPTERGTTLRFIGLALYFICAGKFFDANAPEYKNIFLLCSTVGYVVLIALYSYFMHNKTIFAPEAFLKELEENKDSITTTFVSENE